MNVGVQGEGLAPGVQGHDDAGQGAEVTRVRQHRYQFLFDGKEEQVGHLPDVQLPQVVEVVGDGEDRVVVVSTEQSGLLFRQPAGGLQECALRAGAMLAGVVPDLGVMSVRANLCVATQHGGAAAGQSVCRIPDVLLQGML